MLGHSAIADAAIADVGGVVQAGVAEMSAIGSAASVGVGTLVGTSNISGIFTPLRYLTLQKLFKVILQLLERLLSK